MAILVRYHAAARELANASEERIETPASLPEATLRDLLAERHPALGPHLARMRFARNGDFADSDETYVDGDEVDVLPPVAGGAAVLCELREGPLSIDAIWQAVQAPDAGGVALFAGTVRDHADGKAVARLEYEAHWELALKEMRRVLDRVGEAHPGVRLAALHRIGLLEVGDIAVIVAAAAPHRAEAFAACRAAIDKIKETVPIWKKEWAPDGSAIWVNLEPN